MLDESLECGYFSWFSRECKCSFAIDAEGISLAKGKQYPWSQIESVVVYGLFFWSWAHMEVHFNDGATLWIWPSIQIRSEGTNGRSRNAEAYSKVKDILLAHVKDGSLTMQDRAVEAAIPIMLILLIAIPIILMVALRSSGQTGVQAGDLLFMIFFTVLLVVFHVRFNRRKFKAK